MRMGKVTQFHTALAGLLVFLLLGVAVAEEHSVYVDYVTCEWTNGVLQTNRPAVFHIHVTNNGTPDCFYNPAFGFKICDGGGTNPAAWTGLSLEFDEYLWIDTIVYIPGETLITDTAYFDDLFQDFFFGTQASQPGEGCDSIGAAGATSVAPGLYEGLDANVFKLAVTPTVENSRICLDIAPEMHPYEWNWSGLPVDFETAPCEPNGPGQLPDIVPDWGGPYCYTVSACPCGYPDFEPPTPSLIVGSPGEPLTATFYAIDNFHNFPDPITYSIASGPGEIDYLSGEWTWEGGTEEDICEPIELTINAYKDCVFQDDHLTWIYIVDGPLEFTTPWSRTITVTEGMEATVSFEADGGCPDMPLTYTVTPSDEVVGEYYMDGGTFKYTPATEDAGGRGWVIGATDGGRSDECYLTTVVVPENCCGVFNGGYTGNINLSQDGLSTLSDLTLLIDHLYVSKAPLWCPENGNCNGSVDGQVTLSDVTRLIDRIFISKLPTAPCP